MKNLHVTKIALAVAAVVTGSVAFIGAPVAQGNHQKRLHALAKPQRPAPVDARRHAAAPIPAVEPNPPRSATTTTMSSSLAAVQPSTVTPNSQTLSGPVTLTYNGSAYAFTINNSGSNRGISATNSNSSNISSALFGETYGSGAGLTGYNAGTGGPGGKFEVVNSASAQAGAFASTNGTGPGLLGTITNTTSDYPAVYGQNLAGAEYGIGVEGDGNYFGVEGYVPSSSTSSVTVGVYGDNESSATDSYGVYGYSAAGYGTTGESDSGYGVNAYSDSNYAVYASTTSGSSAVYAENESSSYAAYAVYGTVASGNAIQGVATAAEGYGVFGQSTAGIGVYGIDTSSGVGVYGTSDTGLAGEFVGNVTITGTLTVQSITYSSDRALKTNVQQIDNKDLLERVNHLQISSWNYKSDPDKRHVGPMAQDFHAAFGLNGGDETHISQVDVAGVSLAAIQELSHELQQKDDEISALKAQLTAQSNAVAELRSKTDLFAARMTALEQRSEAKTQTTLAVYRPAAKAAASVN